MAHEADESASIYINILNNIQVTRFRMCLKLPKWASETSIAVAVINLEATDIWKHTAQQHT